MNIELANKNDIPSILKILKQRCEWFKKNKIEQWGDWYYTELYNTDYFINMMNKYKLYVVKKENEVIGVFLLKTEDKEYWKDDRNAYYIHHLATKLGYANLGIEILNFIEKLAKQNAVKYLRLDCMRENKKLNKYYENYGFTNIGEGEEPYPHRLWEKEVK